MPQKLRGVRFYSSWIIKGHSLSSGIKVFIVKTIILIIYEYSNIAVQSAVVAPAKAFQESIIHIEFSAINSIYNLVLYLATHC